MSRTQRAELKWLHLALWAAAISVIWLVLLPRVGDLESVSEHLDLMDRRNVRAGAMYYTDLEAIPLRPHWIEKEIQLWPE
jgi:hypothetical protein